MCDEKSDEFVTVYDYRDVFGELRTIAREHDVYKGGAKQTPTRGALVEPSGWWTSLPPLGRIVVAEQDNDLVAVGVRRHGNAACSRDELQIRDSEVSEPVVFRVHRPRFPWVPAPRASS